MSGGCRASLVKVAFKGPGRHALARRFTHVAFTTVLRRASLAIGTESFHGCDARAGADAPVLAIATIVVDHVTILLVARRHGLVVAVVCFRRALCLPSKIRNTIARLEEVLLIPRAYALSPVPHFSILG